MRQPLMGSMHLEVGADLIRGLGGIILKGAVKGRIGKGGL